MSKKYFISSPSYGFITKKFSRFNDLNLFKTKSYLFTKLNKIKIWYGPATVKGINKQPKVILGIEPNYRFLGKNDEKPKRYLAKLSSNDIEVKELALKNNSDYFCKIYLCVEDIITYIKLVSKNGEVLEIGNFDEKTSKNISFNNDKNPHLIQTLHGFYDDAGLRALGVRHIQANKYFFINNMDILTLRYKVRHDNNFKKHWEKQENLDKLNVRMKAIVKLIFLPDNQFGYVFKYMII